LALYFLESQTQFEFVATEKELQKVCDTITETIEQIRTSDFQPTPGSGARIAILGISVLLRSGRISLDF